MAFDFTASIENDYQVFDGLETVEIKLPGAADWVEVESVLRRSMRIRDANAATSVGRDTNAIARHGHSGDYYVHDLEMHIPRVEFATCPPLGTKIRDSESVIWTVIDDTKNTLRTRWTPRVRNLILAERLTSRVSVQFATSGEDESGSPIDLWAELISGLHARITPMRIEPGNDPDLATQYVQVVIVLGEQVDFTSIRQYRVVDQAGRVYIVDSADSYDRLEFLPQLQAHEATQLHQG